MRYYGTTRIGEDGSPFDSFLEDLPIRTILDFLRSCSPDLLRQYFEQPEVLLSGPITWSMPGKKLASSLHEAIEAMNDEARAHVMIDADRIGALADEPGQAAILSVATNRAAIKALANGYSRGLWMFLHAREQFEHAEEACYADDHRSGRMWSGYTCEKGCSVPMSGQSLSEFEAAIAQHFDSRHAKVEVYRRSRSHLESPDTELIQATIYREGLAGERKSFVKGQLDRLPDRPVIEAAITYEPASGIIEVVASGGDDRDILVRLFADHMLRTPFGGTRIGIRQYRLDHLRTRFPFRTDPADDIDRVQVKLLRLKPHDSEGERVTLECLRGSRQDIWTSADHRFGDRSPLLDGYGVTKARLSVKFRTGRGRRTLPVTITMPHGCDLKERTDRERLIGEKYLRLWGLVRDV